MRFIGNIEAKTDAKGRVFLPVVFRKMLQSSGEEELVLRRDVFQQCLVLYPGSVWNQQMDLLRARLNRWNKQQQQIYRQFVSEAELIVPDGNGRILLPKRCMQAAHIKQTVKFIGMGDTIEIWSKEEADKPFVDAQQYAEALQSMMSGNDAEPLHAEPTKNETDD